MERRGLFVVLEGIDGSGKTTLANALASWARDRRHVLLTNEPGGTAVGKEIRSLLATHRNLSNKTVALLMIVDRLEHVRQKLEPWLLEGGLIICDRYSGSTWAYQVADGVDPIWLRSIENQLRLPVPDLVILLDVPVEIAIQRAKPGLSSIGADAEYLERVRDNYLEQAIDYHWTILDGTRPAEDVFEIARAIIEWKLDVLRETE